MIVSVARRRTFHELRTDGRRVRHGAVRMSHLPSPERPHSARPEVAFSIGRSFGNAVERNRGRRRLRAAFVEAWTASPSPRRANLQGAFLLSGHRGLLSHSFDRLCLDVTRCLALLDPDTNDHGDNSGTVPELER